MLLGFRLEAKSTFGHRTATGKLRAAGLVAAGRTGGGPAASSGARAAFPSRKPDQSQPQGEGAVASAWQATGQSADGFSARRSYADCRSVDCAVNVDSLRNTVMQWVEAAESL